MPLPLYNQVRPGASVSIILEADQATGYQVQGMVEEVLDSGDHLHGVEVRLMDGRVGRVQQVLPENTPQYYTAPPPQSQQPWGAPSEPLDRQSSMISSTAISATAPQQNQLHHPSSSDLLPDGQERSEQMEYFQSYENSKSSTRDDIDQATLQREFPDVDSSLIAALYSDSKSLSATREMLQALGDDS